MGRGGGAMIIASTAGKNANKAKQERQKAKYAEDGEVRGRRRPVRAHARAEGAGSARVPEEWAPRAPRGQTRDGGELKARASAARARAPESAVPRCSRARAFPPASPRAREQDADEAAGTTLSDRSMDDMLAHLDRIANPEDEYRDPSKYSSPVRARVHRPGQPRQDLRVRARGVQLLHHWLHLRRGRAHRHADIRRAQEEPGRAHDGPCRARRVLLRGHHQDHQRGDGAVALLDGTRVEVEQLRLLHRAAIAAFSEHRPRPRAPAPACASRGSPSSSRRSPRCRRSSWASSAGSSRSATSSCS